MFINKSDASRTLSARAAVGGMRRGTRTAEGAGRARVVLLALVSIASRDPSTESQVTRTTHGSIIETLSRLVFGGRARTRAAVSDCAGQLAEQQIIIRIRKRGIRPQSVPNLPMQRGSPLRTTPPQNTPKNIKHPTGHRKVGSDEETGGLAAVHLKSHLAYRRAQAYFNISEVPPSSEESEKAGERGRHLQQAAGGVPQAGLIREVPAASSSLDAMGGASFEYKVQS